MEQGEYVDIRELKEKRSIEIKKKGTKLGHIIIYLKTSLEMLKDVKEYGWDTKKMYRVNLLTLGVIFCLGVLAGAWLF